MANHSSTRKSIRKTAARTVVNRNRRSRIRTFLRKVEEAITSGDQKNAAEAFRTAQSELMRGVSHRIFKLNTASRKLSRLSTRIKSMAS